MKSIIVIIAKELNLLKEFIFPISNNKIHKHNAEFVYVFDFDTIDDARAFLAFDMFYDNVLLDKIQIDIFKGSLSEFRINDLDVSIRTGKSRTSFLNFFTTLDKVYVTSLE